MLDSDCQIIVELALALLAHIEQGAQPAARLYLPLSAPSQGSALTVQRPRAVSILQLPSGRILVLVCACN